MRAAQQGVRPQTQVGVSYSSVDPIINAWTQRHKLMLFTHHEGYEHQPCRSIYTSSADGECCQIWIDPPDDGLVELHAIAIEARDDEQMTKDWRVPVVELDHALEQALSFVKMWMARQS